MQRNVIRYSVVILWFRVSFRVEQGFLCAGAVRNAVPDPFSGRNGVPITLCVLKAELRSGSVPPTPGQTPEHGGSSIIVTTKKKKFRLRRAFITPVLQFRSRFH